MQRPNDNIVDKVSDEYPEDDEYTKSDEYTKGDEYSEGNNYPEMFQYENDRFNPFSPELFDWDRVKIQRPDYEVTEAPE